MRKFEIKNFRTHGFRSKRKGTYQEILTSLRNLILPFDSSSPQAMKFVIQPKNNSANTFWNFKSLTKKHEINNKILGRVRV